jgi:hypothetical protein
MCVLQKGKKAKGPTTQEFIQDVLKPAIKEAKKSVQPKLGKVKGKQVQVKHSFDNARIHQSAMDQDKEEFQQLLKGMGWKVGMRQPLPNYSPDLHQVIEHSHARAVAAWDKWLYQQPASLKPKQYRVKFEQIFKQQCTKEIINADVERLPEVYKWVAEHGGDWAPRKLR